MVHVSSFLYYINSNSSGAIMQCLHITPALCRHQRTLLSTDPMTHREGFSKVVKWNLGI